MCESERLPAFEMGVAQSSCCTVFFILGFNFTIISECRWYSHRQIMVSIAFKMVLICISFVHVSILDIRIILIGLLTLVLPTVGIRIN